MARSCPRPSAPSPFFFLMNEERDSTLSSAASLLPATVNLPLKVTLASTWQGEVCGERGGGAECCGLYRCFPTEHIHIDTHTTYTAGDSTRWEYTALWSISCLRLLCCSCEWIIDTVVQNRSWLLFIKHFIITPNCKIIVINCRRHPQLHLAQKHPMGHISALRVNVVSLLGRSGL